MNKQSVVNKINDALRIVAIEYLSVDYTRYVLWPVENTDSDVVRTVKNQIIKL